MRFLDAEGNGDSIPAAVQAERIALLAGILNRAEASSSLPFQSMQPSQTRSIGPSLQRGQLASQVELRDQSTIYQTSGNSYVLAEADASAAASFSFLPSFLQDIIESPDLSPATSSSSSVDHSSSEDGHFGYALENPAHEARVYGTSRASSSTGSELSIWKLDGEETLRLVSSGGSGHGHGGSGNASVGSGESALDLVSMFGSALSMA